MYVGLRQRGAAAYRAGLGLERPGFKSPLSQEAYLVTLVQSSSLTLALPHRVAVKTERVSYSLKLEEETAMQDY